MKYLADEELQKWKVEGLKKYLPERVVLIGKKAGNAVLIEKVNFAQRLDLPVHLSQEEFERNVIN